MEGRQVAGSIKRIRSNYEEIESRFTDLIYKKIVNENIKTRFRLLRQKF